MLGEVARLFLSIALDIELNIFSKSCNNLGTTENKEKYGVMCFLKRAMTS